MERAFNTAKLPLGAYQFAEFTSLDLDEQWTRSGDEPRVLHAMIEGIGPQPFTTSKTTVLLTEEAQRHLIAVLQANLDDDQSRARELIAVFHPEYGVIT